MSAAYKHADTAVFHAGALGDSVMIWPLLRALVAAGRTVAFAGASSKAQLAAEVLGVASVDGESAFCSALWRKEMKVADRFAGVNTVISLVADAESPAGATWLANAAAVFPKAEIVTAGAPGSDSRAALWARFDVARLGAVKPRSNPSGPLVMHIGAGSKEKRLPFEDWNRIASGLALVHGIRPVLIAGEVEVAQLSASTMRTFRDHLRGRVIADVHALCDLLLTTRVFVGADTGPTHLAAQLGIPTLALFGPTDPKVWAPSGPRTVVMAPPAPRAMEWLTGPGSTRVRDAILKLWQ